MDRRRFLLGSAWAGLAVGLGPLAAGCAPIPSPRTTLSPTAGPTDTASGNPTSSPSATIAAPSPSPVLRSARIAIENERPGTQAWRIPTVETPAASGFLSRASAGPGDRVSVHVVSATAFDVSWYRLGWYDGAGGRLMRVDRGLPATRVPRPVADHATGLAEAPWPVALEIDIPTTWLSGMYLAVFRPRVGPPGCAPLVVRGPAGVAAPVLFVSASTTWQAYNTWGGADFYTDSSADPGQVASARRAFQIGFDRPYALASGAGYLGRWELQFVRWQEREARDVDYAADIDLEVNPQVLAGRRLIVFPGHHEYWSRPMRLALESAIAAGVNVAFLSANEVYWQVRFEPSPLGPARRVTCYKSARLDPFTTTAPSLATVRWREFPVNDPEASVIGQMYGHIARRPADWVVNQPDHWLYEGTRVRAGDRIVNLVGQEYDTYFAQYAPPGTTILAQGPVDAVMGDPSGVGDVDTPATHTATIYTAASGATVFAAGTFQWSWALDKLGARSYRGFATPYDERVVRMTRNLFDRLGDGPAPAAGPAPRRYDRRT